MTKLKGLQIYKKDLIYCNTEYYSNNCDVASIYDSLS